MPRPKRPKLVHTAPTDLRVAEPTITSTTQKQKRKYSPRWSEGLTNGSDDSDGLIRRNRSRPKAQIGGSAEYTMSGALEQHTAETTRLRPPSGRTRAELSRIVREADHMQTVAVRKTRGGDLQSTQTSRPSQMPYPKPSRPAVRPQGDGRSGGSDTNSDNGSKLVSKIQGTPLAQSSMVGRIQFRKRARQPSLLQLAQAELDDTDFSDGNEEFYDFAPADESTPLVKSVSQSDDHRTSSSRTVSGPRKRKLSTPEIQVPASQLQGQRSSSPVDAFQSLLQNDDSCDLPQERDSVEAEPTLPQARQTRTPSPQIFNDILAPPQSSSSPNKPSPETSRVRRSKPAGATETSARNHRSQVSPAPSLQSTTSARQVLPARQTRPSPKPLTTASLQNLLPRRKKLPKPRGKGTYDIPSSSDLELVTANLGEDEDELSFQAVSKMQRKRLIANTKKRGKRKAEKENTETALKRKKFSKTYTRKSIVESRSEDSDTEPPDEDIGPDISGRNGTAVVFDAKAKAEMKRLADKFRQVDEYTLEFEDMTGSSSQIRDAR
ncbi:MAG: hypothetical protein Q9163_006160 [Psora crenata]